MLINIVEKNRFPIFGISKIDYSKYKNIEQYLCFFSGEEIKDIQNIKRHKNKVQTIISHLLIKRFICKNFRHHSHWNQVKILKKKTGQPYILGMALSISISHCDSYCFWSLTEDSCMIGIDCEDFTSSKQKNLSSSFIYEWNIKESYLKMLGIGFKLGTNSIDINVSKKEILLSDKYKFLIINQSSVCLNVFFVNNTIFSICRARR